MEIAKETKELTKHFPASHMRMLLDSDIEHIKTLLETLNIHHRQARSINILGTALKVIAGTPDFNDFENLKFRQQELINSENRQIEINTAVHEKINELTDTVNLITNNVKTKQIDTSYLYETLLARNTVLISEIEILISAIALARIGIIGPSILNFDDVKKLINMHSTNTTITDLMEYVRESSCFPFNTTKLSYDNVADCNNQILAIGSCITALTSTFCKKLKNTTCAQQLHSGSIAHCSTRPSHLEPITLVDEGIIVINDNTAVIKSKDGSEKTVTGTYLLTFEDEVQINGSYFKNKNGILTKLPSSATTTLVNITDHLEILSLRYLKRMNMQNLGYIARIERRTIMWPILSGLAFIAILVGCYLLLKLRQRKNRRSQSHVIQKIIENLKKTEDGLRLEGEELTPAAQGQL